ncbi:hypothetical protein [Streptomyces europaeiscabiei]|uniref:hypothetical protein n=1 Tax=Streptomyces europaeiscabiei TaxID=146819 RepID=UPI002E2E415A|nr:hypothetical protein [Streptomyces europaeiscabiei]
MRRTLLAGADRHLRIPLDQCVSDGPIVVADTGDGLLRALVADGIIVHKGRTRSFAPGDTHKDMEEPRRGYDDCGDRMFPAELRHASTEVEDATDDEGLIVLTLRRSFASTMVRMAGRLDGYRCPCTDIRAGWSEGLGVALTQNHAETCLRDGDEACRLLTRVRTPLVHDGTKD